jgi:hypothetical protein
MLKVRIADNISPDDVELLKVFPLVGEFQGKTLILREDLNILKEIPFGYIRIYKSPDENDEHPFFMFACKSNGQYLCLNLSFDPSPVLNKNDTVIFEDNKFFDVVLGEITPDKDKEEPQIFISWTKRITKLIAVTENDGDKEEVVQIIETSPLDDTMRILDAENEMVIYADSQSLIFIRGGLLTSFLLDEDENSIDHDYLEIVIT